MTPDIFSKVFPDWQITEKIGSGAYGTVYKAVRKNGRIEEVSAIKVISVPRDEAELNSIRAESMSEESTVSRLRNIVDDCEREIQMMASFKGLQNIVSFEDYKIRKKSEVGENESVGWYIFIRMEYLTPLNQYILQHGISEEETVRLGCDICTALELCAKKNVIHRDIKPENIFVNAFGDFKLGDFGIARTLDYAAGELSMRFTPNYMAPEVERGQGYDARADIYSLGLVLYKLLNNNKLPFIDTDEQNENMEARAVAMRRRLSGEQLPFPKNASPDIGQVILAACSADVTKRFYNATALKTALKNAAARTFGNDATLRMFNPDMTQRARRPNVYYEEQVDYGTGNSGKRGPGVDGNTLKLLGILAGVLLAACLLFFAGRALFKGDEEETASSQTESVTEDSEAEVVSENTVPVEAADTSIDTSTSAAAEETTVSNDAAVAQDAGGASAAAETAVSSGTDSSVPVSGDLVYFGSYEQDGDTSNGTEPVLWIVLEDDGDSMLLISQKILECMAYRSALYDTTWEQSDVRSFLNGQFLAAAFTQEERAFLIQNNVTVENNSTYGTSAGSATTDMVYLLSPSEAAKYFPQDAGRRADGTVYAKGKGIKVETRRKSSPWLLRTPGENTLKVSYVSTKGVITDKGDGITETNQGVRPVIRVSREGINSRYLRKKVAVDPAYASVGDWVTFGSYEQDNDLNNGQEAIEWVVLERNADSLKLISRYTLDGHEYQTSMSDTTWENSELRRWLNDEFYQAAFSDADRQRILPIQSVAENNPVKGTSGGNTVTDNVTILTLSEAATYFTSEVERLVSPTAYAEATKHSQLNDNLQAVWFTRTPGSDNKHVCYVISWGEIHAESEFAVSELKGVRPVIEIALG